MVDSATSDVTTPTVEHHEKLNQCFAGVLVELGGLQRHAFGPEKAKWQRVLKKAHSLINHYDRVRRGT